MNKVNIIWVFVSFAFALLLMKQCETKPSITTKTETKIVNVTDTITKVKIDTLYRYVNVEKVKDSIIYRDVATSNTIKAKQYTTEVKSNDATAKLDITTTGELLDVKGYITYPKKETTTETIIRRDNSGVFIYAQLPISSQITSPELGVLFQIKNKLIIGIGAQYINNNVNAVATIGVKL